MQQTLTILVKGKVQGVFFRRHTREKALQLGLTGWVKNEQDGSVRIRASGMPAQITALAEWCKQGPPSANVTAVQVIPEPYQPFDDFRIER